MVPLGRLLRMRSTALVASLVLAGFHEAAWGQSYPACSGDPVDPHPVLSGHVYDRSVATPIVGATVRVWKEVGGKGWAIDCVATTGAGGAWSVARPPGRYKIEATGSATSDVNLGGRWYDVAEPTADGWAGEDADVFEDDVAVANIDVVLPLNGGFDLEVRGGASPRDGVQARLMRVADPRVHHNDQTGGRQGAHAGRFYMRGLVPGEYVLLLHDPSGAYGLTSAGPYTIASNADLAGGVVDLAASPTDGYEPNDTPGAAGAFSVDGAGLHADPPLAWTSTSAGLGAPGDIDWFCWEGQAGDRYHVATTSTVTAQGVAIANPWLDPMVAVWDLTGSTPVLLVEDDDGGPGRDALLDTLDIPRDGDLCVAVTAFGDADWNGAGGQSIGPYEVRVEMGNRRPRVAVKEEGVPVPLPPDAVLAFEDAEIVLDVSLDDPESDTGLTAVVEFVDAFGLEVPGWSFAYEEPVGQFRWTPGPQAAEDGPYALSINAADAELSVVVDLIVAVATVNVPPEMPIAIGPLDGETVTTGFPELSVTNGTDIDGDDLWVEFEAYLDPLGSPWAQGVVPQEAGGVTSWETSFVPDATEVWWRARTYDGEAFSGWTALEGFLVATVNDPPNVPDLEKPALGEVVLVRRPALGVLDSTDPEGDAVSLRVEVAYDATFTALAASSGDVPEDDAGPTTSWTVDADLDWGADVYWRARAVDAWGAQSAWSPTFWFRVKDNVAPSVPSFAAPWGPTCDDVVLDAPPLAIPVNNVVDPEGETIVLEVQAFDAEAPSGAAPLATATAPQSAGPTTEVPLSWVTAEDAAYRVRVRADDGTDASNWATCRVWVDAIDAPTTGFEITEPPEGDVLPSRTFAVDAEVANPSDADAHLPGGALSLAWCLDATGEGCTDVAAWNRLAFAPGATTTFQVAGLEPDGDWTLHACAIDPTGVCAVTDTVSFRTAAPLALGDGDGDGRCGCGAGPVGPWGWLAALAVLARRRRA